MKDYNNKKRLGSSLRLKSLLILILAWILALQGFLSVSEAEIVDRIAATINDDVITLSEFKERIRIENRDVREVLERMINRTLLLSEARRLGISGPEVDDRVLIEGLIERKIKAFVMIPLEKANDFYEKNKEKFKGKEFSDVRDEINRYLIEEETNKRLEIYLIELKKKADIRVKYLDIHF